jgi:hypothetical protein
MATLVSVESYSGTLTRYEVGGQCARATHRCSAYSPVSFTPKVVEDFRLRPDPRFAIDPGPRPTNPPASAGRIAA